MIDLIDDGAKDLKLSAGALIQVEKKMIRERSTGSSFSHKAEGVF